MSLMQVAPTAVMIVGASIFGVLSLALLRL